MEKSVFQRLQCIPMNDIAWPHLPETLLVCKTVESQGSYTGLRAGLSPWKYYKEGWHIHAITRLTLCLAINLGKQPEMWGILNVFCCLLLSSVINSYDFFIRSGLEAALYLRSLLKLRASSQASSHLECPQSMALTGGVYTLKKRCGSYSQVRKVNFYLCFVAN